MSVNIFLVFAVVLLNRPHIECRRNYFRTESPLKKCRTWGMTRGHLHPNSSCLRPNYYVTVMLDYKEKNKVDVSWLSDNYATFFCIV